MTETYKFSMEEKNLDTADDYYPQSRSPEPKKSTINSLQVTLTSLKTQLRSQEIEQASLNQKLNELDLTTGKLTITNQYLSNQADTHIARHAEYLDQKGELLEEIKEWKNTVSCLKVEASRGGEEIKLWKRKVVELQEKQQDLRDRISTQAEVTVQVQDYSLDLDDQLLQTQNSCSKMRTTNDSLSQTLTTLQTFSKSFKKNILLKEKELARCKYQTSELDSLMATKTFQRDNFNKEREKVEWQSKMYLHHNKEIQKTNDKLKSDLQKLLSHLQSLMKTNKNLDSCIKDYSQTGVAAAKKILTLSNK